MSANFYELLKYAATGQASPDMTYYDKMRASTLMNGVVQTLTGQPPLSFKSDGSPLISWSMKGNGQQTGTPTPDNPVMPEFVGVKTANLFDEDYSGISSTIKYVPIFVGDGKFTLSTTAPLQGETSSALFLLAGNVSTGATGSNKVYLGNPLTVTAVDGYITVAFRSLATVNPNDYDTMLNLGSTALPYEPFGWAEKITCAGQTVPVYLGQTQTVRRVKKLVLTGTENITSTHTDIGLFNIPVTDYLKTSGTITNICSHYRAEINVNGWSDVTDLTCRFYGNAGSQSKLLYIRDSSFSTVADFKAYLAAQYAAGHPVTVWYVLANEQTAIVNEPLCKIGDYADELHSEDASVTIPTAKGQNTLTVDTTLQPSEMTITYKG